jgi:hypothetical protein
MVASFGDACELSTQSKVVATEERTNPTSLQRRAITGFLAFRDENARKPRKA